MQRLLLRFWGGGYEADDVICDDGQYDVYLDGDFNVTDKVKED